MYAVCVLAGARVDSNCDATVQVHVRPGDAQLGLTCGPAAAPHAVGAGRADATGAQEASAAPEPHDAVADPGRSAGEGSAQRRITADAALVFRAAQGAGLPADAVARAVKRYRQHIEL